MGTFVNHFNWLSGIFFVMALKYGQGVPIFQGEIYFLFFCFLGLCRCLGTINGDILNHFNWWLCLVMALK